MPPRPSRNLDRALIAAGLALFPSRGCAGLSVREVAEAAGVNLGMFHYHFKSREAFMRALLQSLYEDMFSQLSFQAAAATGPRDNLRAALRFMGRFVRANRPVLARVLADALCGDAIAREFLIANAPRHFGVMYALIVQAQAAGEMRAIPPAQALGFCAGSLAMPILFGGAVVERAQAGAAHARMIEAALLTDAAIDQRIDLALAAIANPTQSAPPAKRKRKPRGKQ